LCVAGRGRRKLATFSKRLHVAQRTRKLRGPLLNILLPCGVVGQQRVVEDQCVNELRRSRTHRNCFHGTVIQVIPLAFPYRLRVGVRHGCFCDENLDNSAVAKRPNGTEFPIFP